MLSKMHLVALASACLATEAVALAVDAHRINHRYHHNKKDVVYQHTELVVHTVWQTVTMYDDGFTTPKSFFKNVAPTTSSSTTPVSSSSSASSVSTSFSTVYTIPTSSASPAPSAPALSAAAPAEAATPSAAVVSQAASAAAAAAEAVKNQAAAAAAAESVKNQAAAAAAVTVEAQASTPATTAASSAAPTSSTTPSVSGLKRGLAYNDASLVKPFMNSGTKCGWAYNWAQTSGGLDTTNLDFVPMLWGPQDMHTSTWKKNADAAVAAGTKSLLSFNECDNSGQCNTSPAAAAQAHITYMNPYSSKAAISAPAITNSNLAGEGVDWLKAWVKACNGQCKFDFCAAHWYSPADPKSLLSHLDQVHEACEGKPVWLTEFAPLDGDAETFLSEVMKELDNNPSYSYVERYSFFFVTLQPHFTSARLMTAANSLSTLGQLFAYS